MHDDRTLVESRLKRVLDERIRPAVYPESVPLEVGIWTAPGEPVPVAEGLAAPRTPIAVGDAWGAPWGTSWITVTGTVPQAWAGRTVEALIDLGFDANMPGFQCEGLVYRPDGTPVKGLNPQNQWVRIAAPRPAASRCCCTSRRPPTRSSWTTTPSCPPSWATRTPPATSRSTS